MQDSENLKQILKRLIESFEKNYNSIKDKDWIITLNSPSENTNIKYDIEKAVKDIFVKMYRESTKDTDLIIKKENHKGVIVFGPPKSGKTHLAQLIAQPNHSCQVYSQKELDILVMGIRDDSGEFVFDCSGFYPIVNQYAGFKYIQIH